MANNYHYCKINGTIYNLQSIENLLNDDNNLIVVMNEIVRITNVDNASAAMIAAILFDNKKIPPIINTDEEQKVIDEKSTQSHTPKCPTCGSPNIQKISTTRKAIGALGFGLLSKTAKSQFECKNCGYKW